MYTDNQIFGIILKGDMEQYTLQDSGSKSRNYENLVIDETTGYLNVCGVWYHGSFFCLFAIHSNNEKIVKLSINL